MSDTPTIAIIGGGLAGASAAINLLRRARHPLAVRLIDPSSEPGRGVAFSTRHPGHLLNAPAHRHIIRPEEPLHFARWLARNAQDQAAEIGWRLPDTDDYADVFPPRWTFGSYVQSELREAAGQASPGVTFAHVRAEATEIASGARLRIRLTGGDAIIADHVVLALGVPGAAARLPLDEGVSGHARYVADPWQASAYDRLPDDGTILIVGTHLTMIDAVIALESRGFQGRILALSRNGVVPEAGYYGGSWLDRQMDQPLPKTAREFLRFFREQVRGAAGAGLPWQAVALGVRPHVHDIWGRFSVDEKRRYNRHIRARAAVGHSAPPDPLARVRALEAAGRWRSEAGRILKISAFGGGLDVRYRSGGGEIRTLAVDGIVNCAGIEFDWQRVSDKPLYAALLRDGFVRSGPTGTGIEATDQSAVIDRDGQASARLSAIGLPLHGVRYESTASSEMREQSLMLAARITDALAPARLIA